MFAECRRVCLRGWGIAASPSAPRNVHGLVQDDAGGQAAGAYAPSQCP